MRSIVYIIKLRNISKQNKYCPKQHAMPFGLAGNYGMRMCDKCMKNLGVEKGYSCVECDYDICKSCA